MQDAQLNINKLVSLTFDENPEVRKEAARSLARHGDPAALFALVELSYDKDPSVRETAMELLDKAKKEEPEVMSFAKIFSTKPSKKSEEKKDVPTESKERVLAPITQLFEKRLGKERADLVKAKMMPQIEKMYLKSKASGKKDGERKVMQEFLTNYLEVISDLEQVGGGQADALVEATVHEDAPLDASHEVSDVGVESDALSGEIEEVGLSAHIDHISAEVGELEHIQQEEIREEEDMRALPDTFFKKAYEVMMLSGGDDKIMNKEMKDMIARAKKEITLAFNLAKKKFKETKITNITQLRNGMRNVNTDPLTVKLVENMEYQRTKTKKDTFTRVVVGDDEDNEGVLYLFDERGTSVQPGQKIQIQKGLAKTFKFSGETALTLGKKSNVYIVL